MPDVRFDEENPNSMGGTYGYEQTKPPKLSGFLVNVGLVKDIKQANKVLGIVAIIAALLMVYFLAQAFNLI